MHDIIKKALDEALTEKYNAELMSCEDTDYTFSGGFLSEMKMLIRKTDNKFMYYSKYFAVAACAVLAIGCAVLLPNLMRHDVDVVEPDSTGTSTVTTPVESTDDVIVTTPEQTTPIVTETTQGTTVTTTDDTEIPATSSEDEADAEGNIADDDTQADMNGEDVVTPVDPDIADDENPTAGGDTDDDVDDDVDAEDDDIVVEDDENPTAGGDADDDVDDDVDADEDDVVIEDDVEGDDTVIEDEEEDVELEDDCDIEEDADVEEDDVVDDENPGCGSVPEFPEGNTLEEIYEIYTESDFDNTKVCAVSYYDKNGEIININGTIFDLSFVEDYIISQAGAVRLDKPEKQENGDNTVYSEEEDAPVSVPNSETAINAEGRCIFVQLGEGQLINNVSFYDYSRRNNYGEYFRGECSEDVDEVDDEDDPFAILVGIEIYENGIAYYGNSVPMQFDPAATAELFKHFDKMGLPDFTNSADELIDYAGITEDSITVGYAKINNVYDIGFNNAAIDTKEEIAGLYSIINSFRGQKCAPSSTKGQVEIVFYVSEMLSKIKLIVEDPFADEPRLYLKDDNNHTYYIYDSNSKEKAQEIIRYICKCAGVAEPYFYVTAEEYLDYVGVDFEGVKKIKARGEIDGRECTYIITDPEKIEKLTQMVLNELGNTKYCSSNGQRTWLYADFEMENWVLQLCEGYIIIGPYSASCFEIDNDVFVSIRKYIKENADEVIKADEEEVFDDVTIEEEIDE